MQRWASLLQGSEIVFQIIIMIDYDKPIRDFGNGAAKPMKLGQNSTVLYWSHQRIFIRKNGQTVYKESKVQVELN
jgi:hypothetical protein